MIDAALFLGMIIGSFCLMDKFQMVKPRPERCLIKDQPRRNREINQA